MGQRALVIASGWPSFSFTLRALGFDVITIVFTTSLSSLLSQLLPQLYCISPSALGSILARLHPKVESLWLQLGSRDETLEWLNAAPNKEYYRGIESMAAVYPGSRKRKLHGDQLGSWMEVPTSHTQHGGITVGNWTVCLRDGQLGKEVSGIRSGGKIRRVLRHAADLTLKGIPHTTGVMHKGRRHSGLSLDDRVKPGQTVVELVAPCVTQKYDLVRRLLSVKELLNVYDVQTLLQDKIENLSAGDRKLALESLTLAAPEKILYTIVETLMDYCIKC